MQINLFKGAHVHLKTIVSIEQWFSVSFCHDRNVFTAVNVPAILWEPCLHLQVLVQGCQLHRTDLDEFLHNVYQQLRAVESSIAQVLHQQQEQASACEHYQVCFKASWKVWVWLRLKNVITSMFSPTPAILRHVEGKFKAYRWQYSIMLSTKMSSTVNYSFIHSPSTQRHKRNMKSQTQDFAVRWQY